MRRATRDECHGRTVAGVSTPPAATHARDVRVTWWYTAVSIMVLHAFALSLWALVLALGEPVAMTALFVTGAAGSMASAILLLVRYWREPLDEGETTARRPVWPLVIAGVAAAALAAAASGSLLLGVARSLFVWCGGAPASDSGSRC